jgi:type II secretory pathway pseudopilin PulG
MNPKPGRKSRGGMSLLELIATTAMMAILMTACVVLVGSGYAVWNAFEQDVSATENGYAVLRHLVRELRQADSVTAISAASNTAGNLSLLRADGSTEAWSLNSGLKTVYVDTGSGNQILATGINQLIFVGYEADGVTATTTVDDIQSVKCTVQVTLTQGGGSTRTVSCIGWIRSW